jgi:hypothetical protein
MAVKFRNVRAPAERLMVRYGVIGPSVIEPDGLLTVTDEAAPAYESQPDIWKREADGPPASTRPTAQAPAVATQALAPETSKEATE